MKQSIFVKLATISLLSIGSLGLVIGGFWISKASSKNKQLQLITDTSQYQEIRNHKWTDIQQIQHFPSLIPTDTQVLQMAYSPGLKPGSSSLQIRLKEPQAKFPVPCSLFPLSTSEFNFVRLLTTLMKFN